MRIETLYCVKPVHAPGRGPTRSTDTHFSVKAGFDISLAENGWIRVEKGGEVRFVPQTNVVCVVPLVEAAEKPAPKPGVAKPKGPAFKPAET